MHLFIYIYIYALYIYTRYALRHLRHPPANILDVYILAMYLRIYLSTYIHIYTLY
jgi:hypothetical protein